MSFQVADGGAPLSCFAKRELGKNDDNLLLGMKSFLFLWFCFFGLSWLGLSYGHISLSTLIRINVFFLVICCLIGLRVLLKMDVWKAGKSKILEENKIDYKNSLAVENILKECLKVPVVDFVPLEPVIGDTWKPFRVDHHLSASLKGQFSFSGESYGFFDKDMSGKGSFFGDITPDLLETSSVVFLKKGKETLRLLTPNIKVFRGFLMSEIKDLTSDVIREGTHLNEALFKTLKKKKSFIDGLVHPRVLDALASSCDDELDKRPSVIVKGVEVAPGVAFATAIKIDSYDEKVFWPSGFFAAIMSELSRAIKKVDSGELIYLET